MKKGFTLIELLAVIVILGFILAIAIPRIVSLVDGARINAYISNEDMLLRGTRNYMAVNESLLPANIGGTIEVSVNHLIAESYMTEIKNPYNRNENCNGYVTITKTNDNEYDYTPHIKCGLNIHSGSEDGLVAHYKFDDFQEPTENLYLDPTYQGLPPVRRTPDYWEITTFEEANVERVENSLNNNLLKRINDNDTYAWAGEDIPVTSGKYYSASIWVWISNDWEGDFVELVVEYSGGTLVGRAFADQSKKGQWQKVVRTGTVETSSARVLAYVRGQRSGYVLYYNMQFEEKPYVTPFVDGIRNGVIKDYSINSNSGNLLLSSTPRWTYDEERNSGTYEFNGSSNYIGILNNSSLNPPNAITVSAWVKWNVNPRRWEWLVAKNSNSGATDGYTLYKNHDIDEIGFVINGIRASISRTFFNTGEWYYLVGTAEAGGLAKFYVNGNLISEAGTVPNPIRHYNNSLGINKTYYYASPLLFDGKMDDIHIYNRALSDIEIKLYYQKSQK